MQQQQHQMQSEPRQLGGPVLENGKTLACGTNSNWRQFDAQIRELISVLVHTNIAQNDIREDCRYLKHRVSNLEQANSQLYTLIKQRYPEYANSCASLQQPVSSQLQRRAASISFLKSDTEHSGGSLHASLEDMITEPTQLLSGSHGGSVTQQQASSPANSDSLSDLPIYNGSGVLLTVPQSSMSAKPNSALYSHARRHSSELDYTTADQTFLDQFIRPAFEETLLRASSTPILPLFDHYSTRFHFFNGLELPYSTECLHRPLHAFDHFTKSSHSCITSGHLSTDSAQETAHLPSDSRDLALPDPWNLKVIHKLSLPNTKSVIYESRQSLDLETMLYQQEQLQKCREAQRNLRYVVFSDTELLTGKFTITSTDDSAIDSGDEEDMQSSRESFGQTDVHSPTDKTLHPTRPSPHNKSEKETELEAVTIRTPDQSNDEICGSTTSRSATPDVVNEKNRNNVPPPVIIYRRRFGLSESGDINTTTRAHRSDMLEADGSLEPTSPILTGQSSPENHSSDTDSCVYNPEAETVEQCMGKHAKFSGCSEGDSVAVTLENVPESTDDWTSTLTKHTQPAKETSCSLSVSATQSLNTDSTCLRNETSKSDRPIVVFSREQNKTSSTTATDAKGFDPRVKGSSVRVVGGNKASSITRETNSHLKAPSHSVSPPSYSTTAYTHTTSRPSTSPRVRRTVGSVNNPTSDVTKTKPSTNRQSSRVSLEQNVFRSSPNSPDQQGISMRKYRMHVTPSVIKPERTSASPSSQADGKESSTSRHGSSDESLNANSTSSSSCPLQDVVSRSLVLRGDLQTMDRSASTSKPLLCPPPIPPRTSSRNHVYQNKAVNNTTSIPFESTSAPQYRSSPLCTYSHTRNILDGNTGNAASARSVNLKSALARPNKHSNLVPMNRKGVIINENSRSRSREVDIDSVHCQPLYSQSFSPVRRFQVNQQDSMDYTYNSHPCSKHRNAAQYYTTQEDYRPTNIDRYPERSDFIYHSDNKPATASPQLGKVHQFEQSRYSVGKRLSSTGLVQRDMRSPVGLGLTEMGYKTTVNNQPYSLHQPIGWHSQDSPAVNRESYRSPKSRYQSRVYTREQPTG
ncbi:hypothetical protein AHF37_04755 [Paragonimus kellicotti]|nr:hypothetical protein AHF37_04755 [Paragonimus kellicotti]